MPRMKIMETGYIRPCHIVSMRCPSPMHFFHYSLSSMYTYGAEAIPSLWYYHIWFGEASIFSMQGNKRSGARLPGKSLLALILPALTQCSYKQTSSYPCCCGIPLHDPLIEVHQDVTRVQQVARSGGKWGVEVRNLSNGSGDPLN